MSKPDQIGIGADLGTMGIIGARRLDDGKIKTTRVRNAFIDLPPEHKRMLKLSNTSFVEIDKRLVVVGDEALETANLLNKDVRRPMAGGVISAGELDAQQIIALIMKKVLGDPLVPGERCCYSVPAAAVDVSGSDIAYHSMILGKILRELGYDPEPTNEALAIIFSECVKENFSGIAISFGSGMVNVCLAYNAMSALEFALGRSGDWVDAGAAKAVGTTAARICSIKESGVDITKPNIESRESEAIALYLTNLIDYTITEIIRNFARKRGDIYISKPLPIIISGGTSLATGFVNKFRERFDVHRAKFPVQISEIRAAADPMNAVAQGLLLLSQSDD